MSDIESSDGGVVITENIEVQVELTPKRLAEVFWAMGENQQAEFFNAIPCYAQGPAATEIQLAWVIQSDTLNKDGQKFLRDIADAVNGRT